MFITQPLFITNAEYENMDKYIEGEDTIQTDQVVFIFGDVTINGTFIVLGQLIFI